jgi:hypothetical protein
VDSFEEEVFLAGSAGSRALREDAALIARRESLFIDDLPPSDCGERFSESSRTMRLPRGSAARWIFAVSPPRERPRAWSVGSPATAAPFCGRRRRAGAHARSWSPRTRPTRARRRRPRGRSVR